MISKRNDGRTKGCDWPSQVGSCVADVLDQVLHPTSVPSLSVTSSLHVDTHICSLVRGTTRQLFGTHIPLFHVY